MTEQPTDTTTADIVAHARSTDANPPEASETSSSPRTRGLRRGGKHLITREDDGRTARARARARSRAALVASLGGPFRKVEPTPEQLRIIAAVLDHDELIEALRSRQARRGHVAKSGDLRPGSVRLVSLHERRQQLLEALKPGVRR